MVSLFAGFVAAVSLILMAVLDTFHVHSPHNILLLTLLGGIGFSSILMVIVWADQLFEPGRLRIW